MASGAIIGWFEALGLADRAEVGGKGGSLGELTRAGIAVPAGFVIRTAAFAEFLATLERQAPVRARIEALRAGDLAAIEACSAELRARFLSHELPATLADELAAAHATLRERAGAADVAVRSSATTEDAADASFAGTAGHLPVGFRLRHVAHAGARLLGESVFGGVHQLPPRSWNCRE